MIKTKCRIRQADIETLDEAFPTFLLTQLAVPFPRGGDAPGQPASSEYSSGDDEDVAQPSAGRRGVRLVAPRPLVWRDPAPADVTSCILCGVTAVRLM